MAKAKKQKSGKWRVQVYDYTDAKGKRHYKSFTADTKKEAEYQAAEYLLTSTRGAAPTYDNLTLGEAYDRYIASKTAVLSPSTVRGYRQSREKQFRELMPVKLHKLTPELIQTAVNEMAADHSPKTVRNAHGLLSAVLAAYRPQLKLKTRLPQRVKQDVYIPTADEVRTLIAAAHDRGRLPIMLAAYGGLRRSEICALTLDDFSDFGVTVNKAVVYDSDLNAVQKTTKTYAGTRFVPLPTEVIAEARQYKHFGMPPATVSTWFERAHDRTDLPHFSFHKLRHFFASELHAQGIPDKYIAEVGGWETVEVLHQIYQHALRDKQSEFSKKITDIFSAQCAAAPAAESKQA
jgi:integrase